MAQNNEQIKNFLSKFRDPVTHQFHTVTAAEFLNCWKHYDKDNNGYLEGEELNLFLREFIGSVVLSRTNNEEEDQIGSEVISQAAIEQLKDEIMTTFDENQDGRIDIKEFMEILPTDQKFLALIEEDLCVPTSVEFMRIWQSIDQDSRGYIESTELKLFLSKLLERNQSSSGTIDADKLNEYTNILLKLFDLNEDGKLQLNEMARLLKVKENYLLKHLFKRSQGTSQDDGYESNIIDKRKLNHIFHKYDLDNNGVLEKEELLGFLKDLVEANGCELTDELTLKEIEKSILKEWDLDSNSQLNKDELKNLILFNRNMLEEQRAMAKN